MRQSAVFTYVLAVLIAGLTLAGFVYLVLGARDGNAGDVVNGAGGLVVAAVVFGVLRWLTKKERSK